MKGLIVKDKWAQLILNGEKTIELRSRNTKIRGEIGIIISGSKAIGGTVHLIDSIELSDEMFESLKNQHLFHYPIEELSYKKVYAWILNNPKRYEKPIPYEHKQGCVIWVNI